MAKGRAKFTQSDVTKAVKGALTAGMAVQRFEIDGGKIVVIAGPPLQDDAEMPAERNEWDEVK